MDPRAESLAVKRLRIFARICFVWGVILVLRLVDLQIFDHEKYRKYADSQHIRKVEVQAARGSHLRPKRRAARHERAGRYGRCESAPNP